MKKFHRKVTPEQIIWSKYINATQRTGFLNEDLFYMDRDIKNYLFNEVLIDPYTSNKYEEVLIAYKELPYDERILQNLLVTNQHNEDIYKNAAEACASLEILHVRLFKCVFNKSFIDINMDKGVEIKETLDRIAYLEKHGYTIIPNIKKFLESQAKVHQYVSKKAKHSIIENDIKDNTVIIAIPIPEDNGSYIINDQIRQPLLTEAFYYEKAKYGYTKFTFKDRQGRNRSKVRKQTAYFIHDIYTKNGYNKEIFHLKFYAKYFVNALSIFEEDEVEFIVKEVMKLDIDDYIKEITLNTYECYLNEYEERKKLGDVIPNIYQYISRDYDVDFTKKKEKMIDSGEINEYLEKENGEDDEDEFGEISAKNEKSFKLDRRIVNPQTIIKLIAGRTEKRFFALYPHLGEELLRISDTNKTKKEVTSDNQNKYTKAFSKPMSLEIYKTIASNSALFRTYDHTNCFDYNACVLYSKYRYLKTTNPNDEEKPGSIRMDERFLEWGKTYGYIDPSTVKSEKRSGTQGNVIGLQIRSDRILIDKRW